jgi:hypothetical protein
MASFTKNSSINNQIILYNEVLTPEIKNILINSFSGFTLDVGTEFLKFETISELLLSRDLGLSVLIISTEGKEVYLTEDQENTIMNLEMYFTGGDDGSPVPELEYYTADGQRIEDIYLTAKNSGDIVGQRDAALKWIHCFSSCEFQKRLLDGTLPEFERDTENSAPLERSNVGLCRLMTDDEHDNKEFNQGYLKRHLLRYISVEDFKMTYYEEFRHKMSIEKIMKQIELETETKVIKGYKTGEITLPNVSDDSSATLKDPNKQINFLQNIMAEEAKKFEAAAGRRMSYSEMRQMFG